MFDDLTFPKCKELSLFYLDFLKVAILLKKCGSFLQNDKHDKEKWFKLTFLRMDNFVLNEVATL